MNLTLGVEKRDGKGCFLERVVLMGVECLGLTEQQ